MLNKLAVAAVAILGVGALANRYLDKNSDKQSKWLWGIACVALVAFGLATVGFYIFRVAYPGFLKYLYLLSQTVLDILRLSKVSGFYPCNMLE